MKILIIIAGILTICSPGLSQSLPGMERAVDAALNNNLRIKSARDRADATRYLQKTSVDLPKTEAMLMYGQYNSYAREDNNITITQSIPFSAFGSQASYNRTATRAGEKETLVTENEISYQVRDVFMDLVYAMELRKLLQQQDSLFAGFETSATRRYETGESTLLEQSTARSQRNQSVVQLQQNNADIMRLKQRLDYLVNADVDVSGEILSPLSLPDLDTAAFRGNPENDFRMEQVTLKIKEQRLEKAKLGPDLIIGYFNQSLIGTSLSDAGGVAKSSDRFQGIQVGLAFPLWFTPQSARIRSAGANLSAAQNDAAYALQFSRNEVLQIIEQLRTHSNNLEYFRTYGLPNADLILKQSQIAFREGEISYAEYLLGVRNALQLKESYLMTIRDFNKSIIYYKYLTGGK